MQDWLDEDEQRIYRVFSRMSRDLFNRFDCDLKQDAGIPRSYYEILFVLGQAPGRQLRMNELADGTRSAPSRITHAVGRLEKDGLVSRQVCAADRRGWEIQLTEAGLAVLHDAARRHARSVREYLLEALTPRQQEELRRISTRVLSRLGDAASAMPPGRCPRKRMPRMTDPGIANASVAAGAADRRAESAAGLPGSADRRFHDRPGHDHRERGGPAHPGRPARHDDRPAVGGQRLQPDVRRAAAQRRGAGRPRRRAPDLRGRPGLVHSRLAVLRTRLHAAGADRRPARAGNRRRTAAADRPHARRAPVPGRP